MPERQTQEQLSGEKQGFRWYKKMDKSKLDRFNDEDRTKIEQKYEEIVSRLVSKAMEAYRQVHIDAEKKIDYSEKDPIVQTNLQMIENYRQEAEKMAITLYNIEKSANTDSLTGLMRREAFEMLCQEEKTKSDEETKMYIIQIDLDNFKTVNETYGHFAGDAVLKEVANAIKNSLRNIRDLACRYGGDEFAVFVNMTQGDIQEIVKRLYQNIAKIQEVYFEKEGQKQTAKWNGSASIGISELTKNTELSEAIFRADAGVNTSKEIKNENGTGITFVDKNKNAQRITATKNDQDSTVTFSEPAKAQAKEQTPLERTKKYVERIFSAPLPCGKKASEKLKEQVTKEIETECKDKKNNYGLY